MNKWTRVHQAPINNYNNRKKICKYKNNKIKMKNKWIK